MTQCHLLRVSSCASRSDSKLTSQASTDTSGERPCRLDVVHDVISGATAVVAVREHPAFSGDNHCAALWLLPGPAAGGSAAVVPAAAETEGDGTMTADGEADGRD